MKSILFTSELLFIDLLCIADARELHRDEAGRASIIRFAGQLKTCLAVLLFLTQLVVSATEAYEPFQDRKVDTPLELLRNKLLKQLDSANSEIVESALMQLEYEYVGDQKGEDADAKDEQAIGIKLSVKSRLIELMESKSIDARELAIRRLGELGPRAASALPKLRELMAAADGRTTLAAAQAFWEISNEAQLPAAALVRLLRDDNQTGQFTAWGFELMGAAGFCEFEAIAALSKDPRVSFRETATKILGTFGPQHRLATEAPLVARLDDTAPEVKIAASLSLLKIDSTLEKSIDTLIGIIAHAIKKDPHPVAGSPAEQLIVSAINAIGRFTADAVNAVSPLSDQLKSQNFNVRLAAADALGQIGPGAEDAISLLARAMQETETVSVPLVHYSASVGDNAAKALGSIGLASVPTLLEALDASEPVVRARAARELGRIPEAAHQTVVSLVDKLSDPSDTVRLAAIHALGSLGEVANLAVPELTKFLFDARTMTSFPSGGGIGMTESMSSEALRAMRSIGATEEQVVPVMLDSLARKELLTIEAIETIRQFPNRHGEFVALLTPMLVEKGLSTACALAVSGAKDPQILVVLKNHLFSGEDVNPIAAMGVQQWIAHGEPIDDILRDQMIAVTYKNAPLSIRAALLRLTPDDGTAVESFLEAMRNASPYFDGESEIKSAERALLDLIGHQSVRDALLAELERRADLLRSRFLSASILIAAQQEVEKAFASLEREVAMNTDLSDFGSIADFLGKLPPSAPSKSLLVKLLNRDDCYVVNGDFYGHGGEMRCVGERAALALVRHREVSALADYLDDPSVSVRLRVVRALGALGVVAITPRLLEMTRDTEPSVRQEAVRTLGRIGLEHPQSQPALRRVIENATKDQRRRVRDEATRTLRKWIES